MPCTPSSRGRSDGTARHARCRARSVYAALERRAFDPRRALHFSRREPTAGRVICPPDGPDVGSGRSSRSCEAGGAPGLCTPRWARLVATVAVGELE
eukprot:1445652-Prymnesium_polylepis.1